MLYLVAVCLTEYRGFRKRRREYRELVQFADFLSNVTYEFYLCKSVTEAIFRAAEEVQGELRKRLEEICFLLEGEETDRTVAEYRYPNHLKYVKLFLLQCRNAVVYGSGKAGEDSLFAKNMTELRRDVQNECYKRSQGMFLFSGLGLITTLPVVCLPLIRQWGSRNMPELEVFYESTVGNLTAAALCLITLCCYGLLNVLKQADGTGYARPEVSCRVLCQAASTVLSVCTVWLLRKESVGTVVLGGLFAGMLGVLGGIGMNRYLAYLRTLGMSGEVLGLQSVILLLYKVPNMTVMKLLTVLEEYAEVFRRSLMRCSDCYAAEDDRALAALRYAEKYPAFRQLAGRLEVSERIGLERAFCDIAGDRQFFREQERLDAEQELKKRAANGQVLAFVPMMVLLFAYLILPFLAASLSQMGEIFREMEQIGTF
ncbi:MAG: hypothetical protein IJW37_05985 [Lachnospiraceae bacterium]|nr:hypothetical protein [Lachnospiraceae bacterium]